MCLTPQQPEQWMEGGEKPEAPSPWPTEPAAEAGADPESEFSALYATDAFRMYAMKILPCSKRVAHNWQQCAFAHHGEKARRRDLRIYSYSSQLCPDVKREGGCPRGDGCHLAHNIFEAWLHPELYRTQLCTAGANCSRAVCFFAHSPSELRASTRPPAASGGKGPAAHQQAQRQQQQAAPQNKRRGAGSPAQQPVTTPVCTPVDGAGPQWQSGSSAASQATQYSPSLSGTTASPLVACVSRGGAGSAELLSRLQLVQLQQGACLLPQTAPVASAALVGVAPTSAGLVMLPSGQAALGTPGHKVLPQQALPLAGLDGRPPPALSVDGSGCFAAETGSLAWDGSMLPVCSGALVGQTTRFLPVIGHQQGAVGGLVAASEGGQFAALHLVVPQDELGSGSLFGGAVLNSTSSNVSQLACGALSSAGMCGDFSSASTLANSVAAGMLLPQQHQQHDLLLHFQGVRVAEPAPTAQLAVPSSSALLMGPYGAPQMMFLN